MLIEPRASNSIQITTHLTKQTYEISDCDELGLCITRTDHKDILVGFPDTVSLNVKQVGKNFMIYLDRRAEPK